MLKTIIQTESDIADDSKIQQLATYAKNLSQQSYEAIQTIMNGSILEEDVQRVLTSDEVQKLIEDEPNFDYAPTASDSIDLDYGLLDFPQADGIVGNFWDRIKRVFSGLRRKVRRIFCRVVAALGNAPDLDSKAIIKDVLIALVPALAATTGLISIALPIVVSLAALYLKYGVSKVCPT